MTPTELHEWNKKIYGDDPEHLQADWFWSQFRIQSAPKFRDTCWSHIPASWEGPVATLISSIQKKYGNKVEFNQIKEKFIVLVVYYSIKDDVDFFEADKIQFEVTEMIKQTQAELKSQGLHI